MLGSGTTFKDKSSIPIEGEFDPVFVHLKARYSPSPNEPLSAIEIFVNVTWLASNDPSTAPAVPVTGDVKFKFVFSVYVPEVMSVNGVAET